MKTTNQGFYAIEFKAKTTETLAIHLIEELSEVLRAKQLGTLTHQIWFEIMDSVPLISALAVRTDLHMIKMRLSKSLVNILAVTEPLFQEFTKFSKQRATYIITDWVVYQKGQRKHLHLEAPQMYHLLIDAYEHVSNTEDDHYLASRLLTQLRTVVPVSSEELPQFSTNMVSRVVEGKVQMRIEGPWAAYFDFKVDVYSEDRAGWFDLLASAQSQINETTANYVWAELPSTRLVKDFINYLNERIACYNYNL